MGGIGGHARSTPDATALVTIRGTTTFQELDERQSALAGLFSAGGIEAGDRIALLSGNRPEFIEVTTGALRCGVVPVPISPLLTASEIAYMIEDSGALWLFSDRALELPPTLERLITFGDAYERCLHDSDPADLSDYILGRPMHYTSGTTGHPKGVWVNPVKEDDAASRSERFIRSWGLSSDDVHLVCSPLTHSAPHRYSARTLEAGGKVVVQSRFDAAETLAAIDLFGATTTFMVPTHLERIFALDRKTLMRHDASSIRMLAHAGAPIRPETKRDSLEFFPKGSVWEFYGSTEGQATRISSDEWQRKPGSVGRPETEAEIIITDEDGAPLKRGEVGEIWIRDPALERFEYWGDKAKTRATWRDGAFFVGDLGYLDDDGYLYLAGRKHDTIITGGVNVYPAEVEGVLSEHPAVAEVVVYGTPHPEWGEEVRARVVPMEGMPLDPEHLRTWARERLAGFKCPRHIELTDHLERTPTGKLKRDL